ncbi:ribose-phosphate diphosphokinase [Candidatus Pacearchaeota archaeon]|nr:ribose-phosphate diphosphokinase [Candidatus Pacearchaeota archaeon]
MESAKEMNNLENIILADPKSNVWNFAAKVYDNIKKIESERSKIGFTLGKVETKNFPDGEFEPRIIPNVRLKNVVYIQDSSKEPARWWVEMMFVNNAAMRGSAASVIDVLPYMRWSRGEKKDKPHIAIASKVFADTISLSDSGAHANRVIALDLHAQAIQGFFNIPFDALYSYPDVVDYIKTRHPEITDNLIVVAPDTGSAERTRAFAKRIGNNIDIAIIDKRRISGEKVEVYHVVGDVKGKNCLLVDDILSSGKTLGEAEIALRKEGAKKVYAYAAHFVGSGNYMENLKGLDKVLTTDTFYQPIKDGKDNEKIEIISIAPLFAEAIYRARKGESISELFQ